MQLNTALSYDRTTDHTPSASYYSNASILYEVTINTIISTLTGRTFSLMPTRSAALFGLTSTIVSLTIHGTDEINEPSQNTSSIVKVILLAADFFLATAGGYLTLCAIGCSSTLAAAILLTGSIILAKYTIAISGNLCCFATYLTTIPADNP
ncbi:MAG: hypothetical protein WCG14_03790 [Chlamydiia bacterium]